ncbi:Gfo/Idh/MocA family oxidoreductase [Desulfovibrionales bacterium]
MLRAALVGLGNIAWKYGKELSKSTLTHAAALLREPRVLLVGGCSPEAAEREAFTARFGVPAFAGLRELLKRVQPHLVSICSPTVLHFNQTRTCLEWGIPLVWLEKPPAATLSEVDALLALQAERRREGRPTTVAVNYLRRHAPVYGRLRMLLHSGELGTCRGIRLGYSRGLETNGSHIIDMLFFILPKHYNWTIEWISAEVENPSFALRVVDPDGFDVLPVLVEGLALPYHNIDIILTCETGRAAVLYGGMDTALELRVEHELFSGFYRLREASSEERDRLIGAGGLSGCLDAALADLLAAHEVGREPVSSLASARQTQALLEVVRNRKYDLRIRP